MKKISLTLLVVLMGITTAFAQISTGEPNASVLPRTGNRPQAGDFGMYLGASVTQIMDLVKLNDKAGGNTFWALPAINLKYYITDNWEFRCGFEFACKGTLDETVYKKASDGKFTETTNKNFTRFLPGAAYHFNTNNILDVYVGAQLPIGFDIYTHKESNVIDGDKSSIKYSEGAFVIGGGIFLGLQFFVADLPFAIGIEGGYSGRATLANKGMTTINNDGDKTKYAGNYFEGTMERTEAKTSTYMEGTWGADAALTFTYYFRK